MIEKQLSLILLYRTLPNVTAPGSVHPSIVHTTSPKSAALGLLSFFNWPDFQLGTLLSSCSLSSNLKKKKRKTQNPVVLKGHIKVELEKQREDREGEGMNKK